MTCLLFLLSFFLNLCLAGEGGKTLGCWIAGWVFSCTLPTGDAALHCCGEAVGRGDVGTDGEVGVAASID